MNQLERIVKEVPFIYNLARLGIQYFNKYCVDDMRYIKRTFKRRIGTELNLENPQTFNDKLQWLKFNWYDERAVHYTDKYLVREHIKNTVGGDILNELYGVYDSVDEIDIDQLPESFVLKTNHGCGWNIICKDKNSINWKKELKIMNTWMKLDYYWSGREWMYKGIQPKIICEKYFTEEDGTPPIDYKIFCYNGEPRFTYVCLDRDKGLKVDYYDIEWVKQPIAKHNPMSVRLLPKPHNYERMLEICRILAEPFPFLRVDLYEIDKKIVFGEMTFSPGNGMEEFIPEKYDRIIGDLLDLSNLK